MVLLLQETWVTVSVGMPEEFFFPQVCVSATLHPCIPLSV